MSRRQIITLALNDWQVEALEPLFDKARRDEKRPGMVVAQVFPDGIRVTYFGHKVAARVRLAVTKKPRSRSMNSAWPASRIPKVR